jgi:hypothetical protein
MERKGRRRRGELSEWRQCEVRSTGKEGGVRSQISSAQVHQSFIQYSTLKGG